MIILLLCSLVACYGWNEWQYSTQWSDLSVQDAILKQQQWLAIWGANSSNDFSEGPRPRRGHSLVLFHSPNAFPYFGETYIIMFGGRDNDKTSVHIPKTYDLQRINGSLVFTTYDAMPVNPCNDVNGTFYSAAQRQTCAANTSSSVIPVGVFYNDVWSYKLCSNQPPYRYFNGPCVDSGWVLWSEGALEGGCAYKLDDLVCTTPSERYNHGAVVFDDGAMFIYGGFR